MKIYLLYLMLAVPLYTTAQRTFKFTLVNALTGKPLAKKKQGTVIKNKDVYIVYARSDANGIFTFKDKDYDSTATYEVEFLNQWENQVEPGLHDITAVKTSQPVVKLTPASIAMPYGCGEVMYQPYHPRTPYTFTDLPQYIQAKIKKYFIKRVGKAFYSKLVLNGGQILDLNRFYKFNPQAKVNGWVPPAYALCFMVWDSVMHTSSYAFQLKLDDAGKLISPVPLPDIRHHPDKARIISESAAIAIAKQCNFYKQYAQTKCYYYPKAGCIVWEIEEHDPPVGESVSTKLLIDAHDGKIVDRLTSKVSIVY